MARRRRNDLAPNPRMWEALDRGRRLREVLVDFYTRVYADPRLSPFFEGVTKDRAIDKQYSFLAQIFTGEPLYFGERPRNAHHWMVISEELFDYRESLMEACLRRAGLDAERIREWRAVEEIFRKQIVKALPVPKKIRGVELPLEGYDTLLLEVSCLCDGCQGPMEAGTRASYHVRTGRAFCQSCSPDATGAAAEGGA
jgi:truncated hemoglobin YjbI